MSQAYQAPPPPTAKVTGPELAIQRPSPKFLMRRAVERVQSHRFLTVSRPQPTRSVQPPQRIAIDWEARLREARQRIAAAHQARAQAAPDQSLVVNRAVAAIGRSTIVVGSSVGPLAVLSRIPSSPPVEPVLSRRAPRSGSQLYAQRLNALRSGTLYTRMPVDCFYDHWHQATGHPSYRQWRELLALEAKAAGRGKGSNALTVMVGDSLSQWFPADQLPARQIWLNQGISGDTTAGMLQRLSVLKTAQPDTIYLMAGVNDLKRGASDREILGNLHQILTRLRQQHPNVRIVVQSILPTRSRYIPNARIAQINPMIQALAQRHAADYLDLHQQFQDNNGELRRDLTTDGIHLSPQGYQVWQAALQRMDQHLAQRPRPIAQASVHRRNL